ncbi:MAG: class I adenylate-forming enzyme family protein [Pseudomonadota bacterium]
MILANEQRRAECRAAGWWGDTTLSDMFVANVGRHPDRMALIDAPNRNDVAFGDPRRFTYAEMLAEVERMAGVLLANGVGKDDVVMVQLPNISELVNLYFATALIGAVISPVAVQYRSHELSAMIGIAKPRAFVCATRMKGCDHVGTVRPLLGGTVRLFTVGPDAPDDAIDLSTASAPGASLAAHRAANPLSADDMFTICWTSGTTGAPKGVPRSYNHWVAISPGTYESARLRDGDIMLNPFPLINMASIGGVTMSWLKKAGTMVLHHPFDPKVFLAQIATERPHFTIAPPAVLNMLLQDEALLARVDLSSLRSIGSGSAPLAPAMVKGFQDRFGIMVINLFGSNEGMALVTGPDDVPDPEERARYFPRSALFSPPYGDGRAPNIETRLVPPKGGAEIIDNGVSGELQIKGPTVFEGYYGAPEQTAAAFTEDGFFKTGDLFEIAGNGRFYEFVGRCKDLIIRGGVNIAPEEIDQLLSGHPKLQEACAFPLPDPVMGERIGVAAVPRAGEVVALDDITAWLKAKDLAVFKLPERLFIFDELPRNVTNKVMRSDVRDRAVSMLKMEDRTLEK